MSSTDDRVVFLQDASQRGLTLAEIGGVLGVTRERARQLLNREGLNSQRLEEKRRSTDALRRSHADAKFKWWHVVKAMQGHGLPVEVDYQPSGLGAYRVVVRLGGQRCYFRSCMYPRPTAASGPLYWRSGPVQDKGRPVVLYTPEAIFIWTPPIQYYALYVPADRQNHRMPKPDITIGCP